MQYAAHRYILIRNTLYEAYERRIVEPLRSIGDDLRLHFTQTPWNAAATSNKKERSLNTNGCLVDFARQHCSKRA
jgi:hypothetical protein